MRELQCPIIMRYQHLMLCVLHIMCMGSIIYLMHIKLYRVVGNFCGYSFRKTGLIFAVSEFG